MLIVNILVSILNQSVTRLDERLDVLELLRLDELNELDERLDVELLETLLRLD